MRADYIHRRVEQVAMSLVVTCAGMAMSNNALHPRALAMIICKGKVTCGMNIDHSL